MAEVVQQVSDKETTILMELAESCLQYEGDLVELGCYRGDTSLLLERLLERRAPQKRLFIYDSFEGLPVKSAEDASVAGDAFQAGELNVSKREVVERFKKAGLKIPRVKKGWFKDLAPTDLPEQICFGFLDGDLYASIKVSLKLAAPKLVNDGVLVVHDYNNSELPGVTQAVEEFLQSGGWQMTQRESLAIIKHA